MYQSLSKILIDNNKIKINGHVVNQLNNLLLNHYD